MTENQETPAAAGHNQPPSDAELLRETLAADFNWIPARADELAKSALNLPEYILEAEDAHRAVLFAAQVGSLLANAEEARKERKRPIDDLLKAVDGFFKAVKEREVLGADGKSVPVDLEEVRKTLLEMIADYQLMNRTEDDPKARIRTDEGPLATLTERIEVVIDDPSKVPAQYWTVDERGVKAVAKSDPDKEIPGVRIIRKHSTLIK